LILHRPLPVDAVIKLAVVKKVRIGTRSRWQLNLTFDSTANRPPAVRGLERSAALDIGWRARLPGLRVFQLVGSDGHKQEFMAPDIIAKRLAHADFIRSRRDKERDEIRGVLVAWLKAAPEEGVGAPEWLTQRTENLASWKSIARLSSVVSKWRNERFAGDETIFPKMLAWWQHNRHLYQWECSERTKAVGRRNEIYRLMAIEIVKRYASITLERLDLSELIRRAPPETKEALTKASRHNRFVAAPGVFRAAILTAAAKHGTLVHKKEAQYTTLRCHACGHIEKFDKQDLMHTCSKCLTTWDQDENACFNLASAEAAE
jgi:hypothetical protein